MSLWDDYKADCQFNRDFPYGLPGDKWVTIDGTEIKLRDMTETHIRNCMKLVGEDDEWYSVFQDELNKREEQ